MYPKRLITDDKEKSFMFKKKSQQIILTTTGLKISNQIVLRINANICAKFKTFNTTNIS